jgi:glutamyl-Q tRNA(Asp) synthetase
MKRNMPGPNATPRAFRFAPSPNGYLHRGHALSALLNARAAAATGGRFLVRIEDYDPTRSRPEFEAAIFEDLSWLGLAWEEPVLRQSERLAAYSEALDALQRLGLLYPAFMTRAEIAAAAHARDPDGAPLYPGGERDWSEGRRRAEMASGRPYGLRLDMRRVLEALPPLTWTEADSFGGAVSLQPVDLAAWGDVLLARKDVRGSYHLTVVLDDAFQGVTDVVRGNDLAPSTSVHRALQTLLGLPEPRYFHHRLILDESGEKLAKSRGSQSLRARRAAGENPEQVIAGLGLA